MCDSSISFGLQLLGVSLHISQVRRLRLREIQLSPKSMWVISCILVSSPCSALSPTYPAPQLDSDPCVKFHFFLPYWNLVQFHTLSLKLWDGLAVPEAAFSCRVLLLFAYINPVPPQILI